MEVTEVFVQVVGKKRSGRKNCTCSLLFFKTEIFCSIFCILKIAQLLFALSQNRNLLFNFLYLYPSKVINCVLWVKCLERKHDFSWAI